jgi:hypothetical protein
MSLGIVIKGPEGLVLAAESRVTLTAKQGTAPLHVHYDNATKLLSFSQPNIAVGAVTYGQAAIGLRSAHSFVPEFEAALPTTRLSVEEFAGRLRDFFVEQWNQAMKDSPYTGPSMTFVVGGFDENEPYGRVFLFEVPGAPTLTERNAGAGEFGITWGGQREFVDRLIRGFDPRIPDILTKALSLQQPQIDVVEQHLKGVQMALPLAAMPLQDCVDLAIFFVRTTINAQRLTIGIRGCGGPIDVATITRRDGLRFVQQKQITGENAIMDATAWR